MQVVAYQALDGKLFAFENQQKEYDQKYLNNELLKRLASILMEEAPYYGGIATNALAQQSDAIAALKWLFTSEPEEVIKAVKALSGK